MSSKLTPMGPGFFIFFQNEKRKGGGRGSGGVTGKDDEKEVMELLQIVFAFIERVNE